MLLVIFACVTLGFILGLIVLPSYITVHLDTVTTAALSILLVTVGIGLGRNRSLLSAIRSEGLSILALPIISGLGSLTATAVISPFLGLPLNQGLAIGSGFGWYSLSGVLISNLGFPELGGLAFLTNVFRELLAIVMIPYFAKRLGPLCAIAPGGATTMDTTLPLITKSAGETCAIAAIIHGMALSSAVPFLVSFFIQLAS